MRFLAAWLCVLLAACQGVPVHEVRSSFSHIQVRDYGERRAMLFLDANLRPREDTDASGQPLRLKTAAFLRSLQERLNPGGVVVFNLMEGPHTSADIATLRAAFAHAVVFHSGWKGNLIVVALQAGS